MLRQVIFTPTGEVDVYHGYTGSGRYFVPFTETLDPIQHPYWQEWARRSPFFMPQCQNCEALGFCGGGCPYNADIKHNSIWHLDEDFCIHAITTLHWLLEDLYRQTQEESV